MISEVPQNRIASVQHQLRVKLTGDAGSAFTNPSLYSQPVTLMSAPFYGQKFTFTQPDGSTLPVRGWGDQYNARFETLDGVPVAQNSRTGFYEYAEVHNDGDEISFTGVAAHEPAPRSMAPERVSPRTGARLRKQMSSGLPRGGTRWEERRAQNRTVVDKLLAAPMSMDRIAPAPPQRRTIGTFVGLCLLIDFADEPSTVSRDEIEAFCNQPGYRGFGNNGSVYDYFLENSLGRLQYTNVVAPYYRAQHPRGYYTDESIAQPIRTYELVQEALQALQARGFNFSALTSDNKGYVYAMNVYYAGERVNNWSKGLWPHAHHLEQPLELAPGKFAYDYQITDIGAELTLGTFCHENGHMVCDFPDLYDYDSDSQGVGIYCLMCAGGATPQTMKNPTAVGAYLKLAAGWHGSVTRLSDGLNATAVAQGNHFFIHPRNQDEYFLLENRFQADRDQYLTDSGLAIWHIDHRGDNSFQEGSPAQHYECALMQADGRRDLERNEDIGDGQDLFKAGGNTRFTDGSRPGSRWWNQTSSGLEINGVGPAGQQINFDVRLIPA
jgi:M6 family metalloprotease-like protein